MQRKHLIVAIVASLGLVGAIAFAANRGAIAPILSTTASNPVSAVAAPSFAMPQGSSARIAAKPAPAPAPPTVDDVGDVDSFGRNVRWLGVVSTARVYASTNCASILASLPDVDCRQIASPADYSTFDFERIDRITLPANASNSLLCHWLSRTVNVRFKNPTANPVRGRVTYTPYFTVENPVLNDPSLIDPSTGAPFGGKVLVSAGTVDEAVAVLPNIQNSWVHRDAMVCQSGLVSKRALVETYGLTRAQADSFFASPMTVWLNVEVNMEYADTFSFNGGLRIVGD